MALAKAGLSAATSYFYFGDYDHPSTQPGVHLFSEVMNPDSPIAEIGYVHTSYAGGDFPVPSLDVYQNGWAPLVQRNGIVTLGTFKRESWERENGISMGRSRHAWNVANKHDMIDQFIKGFNVTIKVDAYRDLALKHMEIWGTENIEEARELSNNQYFSAVNYQKASRKGYENHKKNEQTESFEQVSELFMPVVGGEEEVNMFTLPSGQYPVCDFRGKPPFRGLYWNPENPAIVERWKAFSEMNHQVKVEG